MRRTVTGAALHYAALGLVLLAALQLAACTITLPFGAATPAPTTLACADHPHGSVDTINHEVTCIVSGAPASQTGFWLYFALTDPQGHQVTFQGTCQGTLTQGRGACTQTYAEIVGQFNHPSASVTGILLPSQQPLGPVSPTVIAP